MLKGFYRHSKMSSYHSASLKTLHYTMRIMNGIHALFLSMTIRTTALIFLSYYVSDVEWASCITWHMIGDLNKFILAGDIKCPHAVKPGHVQGVVNVQ